MPKKGKKGRFTQKKTTNNAAAAAAASEGGAAAAAASEGGAAAAAATIPATGGAAAAATTPSGGVATTAKFQPALALANFDTASKAWMENTPIQALQAFLKKFGMINLMGSANDFDDKLQSTMANLSNEKTQERINFFLKSGEPYTAGNSVEDGIAIHLLRRTAARGKKFKNIKLTPSLLQTEKRMFIDFCYKIRTAIIRNCIAKGEVPSTNNYLESYAEHMMISCMLYDLMTSPNITTNLCILQHYDTFALQFNNLAGQIRFGQLKGPRAFLMTHKIDIIEQRPISSRELQEYNRLSLNQLRDGIPKSEPRSNVTDLRNTIDYIFEHCNYLINGQPLVWAHHRNIDGVVHSYGQLIYKELILKKLNQFLKDIKENNTQEDKDNLFLIINLLKEKNTLNTLFSDHEIEERQFFAQHLEALLFICGRKSNKFNAEEYTTSLKTNRPEVTEDFLILFTKKCSLVVTLKHLKDLATCAMRAYPKSGSIFMGCIKERKAYDEGNKAQAAEQEEHERIEAAERAAATLKIELETADREQAERLQEQEYLRDLAAAAPAGGGGAAGGGAAGASYTPAPIHNTFNHDASWADGTFATADNADIYKVGRRGDDQQKQYALIPTDLANAFGMSGMVHDKFLKRASSALGDSGLKIYKTDKAAQVVELKSLAAQNAGDRIYFTRTTKNSDGETLFHGAVIRKHGDNPACMTV